VQFVGRVVTDVLPKTNNAYDLGSSSLRWANVYGVNGDFSTVTVSGLTPGSVIFAGTGGALSQDNANFFWDDANNRLGIGTNTPAATLHVVGTAQVSGNTSVGGDLSVGGNGSVTGSLTVAGNTTLGDAAGDVVVFNARVGSDVVPSADNTYDLGENTTPLRWRSGYFGTQVKVGASVSLVAATNALEYTGGDGRISVAGASALRVSTNGVERLIVDGSGHVLPGADNTYNLGSATQQWANIYGVNGSLSGSLTVAGTLNVGGGSVLQGNTVIGGAATDEVQFVGRVVTDVLPKTNNAYDLGSSSLRWANVYGVNGDFSTVTVSGLTPGSVIFAGTGGALSQDNANFFWDDANNRLGIGTNTPAATLHVVGTAQVSGNTSVGGDLSVGGNGSVTGNLTVDGNTTLGNNAAVDLVTFNARVQSDVVPSTDNTYDLGEDATPLRWRSGYFGTQVKVGASVSLVAATNALEYTGGDGRISVAGAQALRVSTNGVERLRVEGSGDVVVQNQDPLGTPTTTVLRVLGGNNGAGATQVVLQAGAGQSGVNLLEWQDNSGNILGVIDADGLVGIGTATPVQKLHVEGNGSVSAVFVEGGVGVGTVNPLATLHVYDERTLPPGATRVIIQAGANQSEVNLLEWQDNSGNILGVIDADGLVGIGTTTPVQTLDVNGTVAFSATATLTNTGSALTLPSNVAVVEIVDCLARWTAANINVNPPTSGTQGQLLFIRYSGTQNLTLVGVLPGGGNQTASAQFHAILMYIGGAWRLMSFVD